MILGKFFGALRAQLNKLANMFFESDPIAVMQLEVDQATERLKEGRKGLEMYRGLVEAVARQVTHAKSNATALESQIKAHLKAGNRDMAGQLALQLQKVQTELATNEGQLQMHEGAYQNNLLKIQKAPIEQFSGFRFAVALRFQPGDDKDQPLIVAERRCHHPVTGFLDEAGLQPVYADPFVEQRIAVHLVNLVPGEIRLGCPPAVD